MDKFKFAAILAAGAVLGLSPAYVAARPVAAQAVAKPVSMGIRIKPHEEGAEIIAMLPNRTGAAVGMKVGDILIEIAGKPAGPEVAREFQMQTKAGDQVSFKVKRAGAIIDLAGKAVAAPEGAPAPAAQPQE
jgi:C-terminal processing protease CtpA/Prc